MNLMEIKILNTAIERVLNNEMAAYELTYTQAAIIGFLSQNQDKEICQKDVEHDLGLTHPTVSSILNRLDEKKLITTVPLEADRRFKQIRLTPQSMALHQKIYQKIEEISQKIFEGVSLEQQQELSVLLLKMTRNLSK